MMMIMIMMIIIMMMMMKLLMMMTMLRALRNFLFSNILYINIWADSYQAISQPTRNKTIWHYLYIYIYIKRLRLCHLTVDFRGIILAP